MQQTLKEYNFDEDIKNDRFEKIFADDYLGDGKSYTITTGYFPDYDVKDLDTGETYEIKRDYVFEKTKNVLVEEWFNLEKKTKGWAFHTKADWLVVFFRDDYYYITNMRLLLNDFFNKKNKWVKKDITQESGFITRNWVTKLCHFEHDIYNIDKE